MIQGLYKIFNHWGESGTTWIISDTHFNDSELAAGVKSRPTDDELVKLINSKCGRADTLIHLGDVGDVTYIRQLRAKRKILIMGNHDIGRTNYERDTGVFYFAKEMYHTMKEVAVAVAEKFPNYHFNYSETEASWVIFYDNCLFDEVYEGQVLISEKLILSHEPVDVPWAFNIHGHCHSPYHKNNELHFNACLDATGYEPINFNQWMKQGYLAHIQTLHQDTINHATKRARKRGKR